MILLLTFSLLFVDWVDVDRSLELPCEVSTGYIHVTARSCSLTIAQSDTGNVTTLHRVEARVRYRFSADSLFIDCLPDTSAGGTISLYLCPQTSLATMTLELGETTLLAEDITVDLLRLSGRESSIHLRRISTTQATIVVNGSKISISGNTGSLSLNSMASDLEVRDHIGELLLLVEGGTLLIDGLRGPFDLDLKNTESEVVLPGAMDELQDPTRLCTYGGSMEIFSSLGESAPLFISYSDGIVAMDKAVEKLFVTERKGDHELRIGKMNGQPVNLFSFGTEVIVKALQ